ncbi:putative ribokinase [Cladophialophora chaetospira]|uniref:Ribokinase n=1 Tax=Cladophialophora chaetospira TaxID=386627 RepID=A0AA39CKC6_9EURO|nr:putative ribokinase [Cladophialophora chaetospira]
MMKTAAEAKIDFLLNAAPANQILTRLYPFITHLLLSETEAATMSGRERDEVHKETWKEVTQDFLGRVAKNVVITLGAQGAYSAREGEYGHIPAFTVKVVDCTGAGDTFTGAYATEYLRQKRQGRWDIRAAVIYACKAAALTITKIGAQEGIPWMDEIQDFHGPADAPSRSFSEGSILGTPLER